MQRRIGVLAALSIVLSPAICHGQARVEANVVYGMYSGLALLMDVHYPSDPNGYGIIVIPGSGWHQPIDLDTAPLKSGQDLSRFLAANVLLDSGYTLFVINHRSAPVFRYPAAVEDAQRAVRFVRYHAADHGIDAANIGAIGHSSGAHLVSLLGVLDGDGLSDDPSPINQQSAKVQAVVALATTSDLEQYALAQTNGSTYIASFIGFPYPIPQMPDSVSKNAYREASPATYISADDAPILLVHGEDDPTVPYSQSEQFYRRLSDQGVATSLIGISAGGHIMQRPESDGPSTEEYYPQIVSWFDMHLPRND